MASLPTQPPAPQRQTSHQRTPSPSTSEARPPNRSTQSLTSEDSQTILIGTPTSSPKNGSPKPFSPTSTERATAGSSAQAPSSEPRKCWICFSDETEDNPMDSEWVSPCPCALTAHHACLLDWVADLKAPNRKNAKKVQCPQCKADIKVAQPRSMAVTFTHAFERVGSRMRVPLLGMFAGSMLAGGCFVHGLAGIYIMMGPADAVRLLGIDSPDRRMSLSVISSIPLVPVALALSRFSVADGVLPVLPMIYLMGRQRPTKSGPLWPPSMMMTLCALPYIRSLYNGFHKKVISPKEKAWLKEIQPRGGEDSEENPINDDAAQPAPEVHDIVNDEDGMDFELGVQVEVIEEEEGVGQLQPDNAAAQIQPPNDNDDQNQAPQPRPDIDQAAPALAPNQPAPLGPHAHHFQRNIQIDVGAIMNAVIGAMLFPTISAFMGGVLYGIVPSRFTAPPRSHWLHGPARQTGLLQSRWGRSLVGGLLFVVLKDALVFWTRWSMKEDHKQRKVLNHWEKEEDVASERKGGAWWRRFWR